MVDFDASVFVGTSLRFSFFWDLLSRFSPVCTPYHLKRCWFSAWEILSGGFITAPVFLGAYSQGTCGRVTISGITAPLLSLG